MSITRDRMQVARKRAHDLKSHVPQAVAVDYARAQHLVYIHLVNGVVIGLPAAEVQGLETASADDLADVQVSPSGYGIHFPRIDVDLYLPALLEGILGSTAWMAERGRKGGHSTSEAKKIAAQANGKLGGRPRKTAKIEKTVAGKRSAAETQA